VDVEIEERYQGFKREVLSMAALEDEQGIWEPLWYANSELTDIPEARRIELAERALTELYDGGLIRFSRHGPWLPDGVDADPGPLNEPTVRAAIASTSWRSLPISDGSIWFEATDSGEEVARAT
jgi:hypothetical protein